MSLGRILMKPNIYQFLHTMTREQNKLFTEILKSKCQVLEDDLIAVCNLDKYTLSIFNLSKEKETTFQELQNLFLNK